MTIMVQTSCSHDHDDEFLIPTDNGALIVELRSESPNIQIDDIHLFIFDGGDLLADHRYFTDPRELASRHFYFPADRYTVIAVMNVGPDFMPPTRADLPEITLPDFNAWLNAITPDYPDMLTGMVQTDLPDGEVKRVVITLRDGTAGIILSTLRLLLELPSPHLPDYPGTRAARADAGYSLRCVAEVYRKGTDELIHRRTALPAPTDADGLYRLELSLDKGDYDLRLWTDYVPHATAADYHYSTADLRFVIFNPDRPYTACTDSRDATYATATIALTREEQEETVAMERPLAKYRLVATDLERYLALVTSGNCPPLNELTVSIHYEGFFPCSFNITTGRPNDAATGMSYASVFTALDEQEMQVGCDWVMVNGDESAVTVTIRITDSTGEVITQVGGIRIPYKRSHLTTIRGDFLTAGRSSGGIIIDTDWAGEYEVIF